MTQPAARVRRIGVTVIVIAALVAGAVVGYQRVTAGRDGVQYVTRPVAYADITSTANETGTVNPVDEVQVGTQVSGTIATLSVDYNSRVKKGEVLATLDPTNFQAAVSQDSASLAAAQANAAAAANAIQQNQASAQAAGATLAQQRAALRSAQANVAKAQATLALAQKTVQRDAQLLAQGYIPQNQMDTDRTAAATDAQDVSAAQAAVQVVQAQVQAAAAQLQSARDQVTTARSQAAASQHQAGASAAQLKQAQYNLSQTVIRSPVDGIVMARNVSVGQTVAASFSTPTLFTLATNLTDMQVDTSVDEADIGSVKPGESAQITVTAFPNVTFAGTVVQVRINPTVTNNVVTYDAVVAVHDTSGRLLPGMTAQVTIDTGTRTHVLAIPVAAVLFRPIAPRGGSGGGAGALVQTGTSQSGPPVAGAPGSTVTVWTLRNGRPAPARIVIGASDGQSMEVSRGLQEGDPVIVAERRGASGGRAGGQGGPSGGASNGSGPGGGDQGGGQGSSRGGTQGGSR